MDGPRLWQGSSTFPLDVGLRPALRGKMGFHDGPFVIYRIWLAHGVLSFAGKIKTGPVVKMSCWKAGED